jgi:hypothetical protein
VSENLLLKDCLDAFLKNLEEDATYPKELTDALKELRATGKLTKGEHLKFAIANFVPKK